MPIGSSKIGVLGAGLVPGGSVTFNAPGTWSIPPGVKKVSITGKGGTGNPGNPGNPGNAGNFGLGGAGGGGGGGLSSSPPALGFPFPLAPFRNATGGGRILNRGCINKRYDTINGGFYCSFAGFRGDTKAPNVGGNNNPGSTGSSGGAGSAGNAGTAGNPGNPGGTSSGLSYCFSGGSGGNAGAAGNAGTAGSGGAGGGGGNAGSPVTTGGNGGAGGTGGGSGGSGNTRCYPTVTPPDPSGNTRGRFGYGGGGGGGAGTTNSGNPGRTPNEWPSGRPPRPNNYMNFVVNNAVGWCLNNTAACGQGGGYPGFSYGCRSAAPFNVADLSRNMNAGCRNNTGGGAWGPPNRFGGPGRSCSTVCPFGGYNIFAYDGSNSDPARTPTNELYRSGAGGGIGGSVFLKGNALPFTPCFVAAGGGGGGGGGRGNAGNAGGTGGAGGSGQTGTPQTYNCVPVTPGGSAPITVASPGGQVVISWNPQ